MNRSFKGLCDWLDKMEGKKPYSYKNIKKLREKTKGKGENR